MTGVGTLDIASLSSLLARVAAVEESHAREKLPNECAESNGEESGCGTLWEQQVGNGNNKGNNSYTLSSTPLSSLPLRTLLPSPSLQTAPTDMQPLPLCTARPREMSGYLSGGFAHITPTTSPVSYQGGLSSSVLSGVGTQSGSVSHIGVSGCGGASAFSTLASGSASSATSSSQAHVVIPQTLLSGTGDDDGVGERSGNNFCPLLENRHWNAVHSTDASSRDVGVTHGAAAATSLTFSSSGRKTAPRDRCNVAGQPSSTASCVHVNGVALSESVVTVGGGKAAVTMHRHAQPQEPVQTQNQPVTEANIYLQGLLRESHPPTSNAAHGTGTNSFTSLNKSVGSVSMWNTCGHAMELTQSEHSKLNTHCSHRLADPMLHKVRVGANNVTIPCAEGSRHIVVGGGGNRDGVPVVATAALDVQRPQLCPSVAVFLPNNGGDLHQQHTPAAAATSNNTIINSSSIPNNSGSFHSLTLSNAHLPGNVENVGVVYQPCAPQQLLLTNSSVVKMVNDQAGCRDLQFVLEHFPFHSVQVQGIIAELLPVLPHVMMNQYGNFLVQKLLEIAPDAERLNMLEDYLSSSLCEIAVSPHGNYAVQKLIDSLRSQHETKVVCDALRRKARLLMMDPKGSHVVLKLLQCVQQKDVVFLYDLIVEQTVILCNDKQGCCVVQKCMDHASPDQLLRLQQAILKNIIPLAMDPFGNYVVTHLISSCNSSGQCHVVDEAALRVGHVIELLCTSKFASNVVEKIVQSCSVGAKVNLCRLLLQKSSDTMSQSAAVLDAQNAPQGGLSYVHCMCDRPSPQIGAKSTSQCGGSVLEAIMLHPYGNYVVQSLLVELPVGPELKCLLDHVSRLLPALMKLNFGKRVSAKAEKARERIGLAKQWSGAPVYLTSDSYESGAPTGAGGAGIVSQKKDVPNVEHSALEPSRNPSWDFSLPQGIPSGPLVRGSLMGNCEARVGDHVNSFGNSICCFSTLCTNPHVAAVDPILRTDQSHVLNTNIHQGHETKPQWQMSGHSGGGVLTYNRITAPLTFTV